MSGLKRFGSRWQNLLGLALVGFYVFVAIAAPFLAPDPNPESNSTFQTATKTQNNTPHPPSKEAPFGTISQSPGNIQMDIYTHLVWGTRAALAFGLIAALGTALFGVLVGAISAFIGGWVNNLTMRVTDAFLTIPIIVGIVIFVKLLEVSIQSSGILVTYVTGEAQFVGELNPLADFLMKINPVLLAIIFFSWMPYARITNAMILNVKNTEYVQAATALGATSRQIIFKHLIPNSISPGVVLAARDIGGVVLLAATLTFIGFPGGSEWGALLVNGRRWIIGAGGNLFLRWWVFIPATLTLLLFGIAWNLLGDGLNDWLNPRTSSNSKMKQT